MTRSRLALAAVLVAPLALTACSGSTDTPAVQQVTLDATDNFRFVPSRVTAHTGTLRITLVDKGAYPHNISFPALHATSATVSGNPGQDKTTMTVTFAHPGTYAFECKFHSSAGMKGEINVS